MIEMQLRIQNTYNTASFLDVKTTKKLQDKRAENAYVSMDKICQLFKYRLTKSPKILSAHKDLVVNFVRQGKS